MQCWAVVAIKGLENCVIESEKNLVIREYNEIIKDIKLRQYERTSENNREKISELVISFWPIEFEKRSTTDLRETAKKVAKLVVKKLLDKGFDISGICIEAPSIGSEINGRIRASNQITLKNINDGSVERKLEEKILEIDSVGNSLKLISILEEQNEIQKFENLYEILKKICGNQESVTKKIKTDFADKYDIKCDNENIDSEYARKHPGARLQDDFTYLRTMISHGTLGYSEEITKRLQRDLIKIVKVINDLDNSES